MNTKTTTTAVVERAVHPHMTGGRRGGMMIRARPARVALCGVIWSSPLPLNLEDAEFYNGAAEALCVSATPTPTDVGAVREPPNGSDTSVVAAVVDRGESDMPPSTRAATTSGASRCAHTSAATPNTILNTEQLNPEHAHSESICAEADRIVANDRNRDYGHPLDDFAKTAGAFAALTGIVLTPEQVGLFMICVKLSRECNRHKRDNLVDAAGYAKTIQVIHEERERRAKTK